MSQKQGQSLIDRLLGVDSSGYSYPRLNLFEFWPLFGLLFLSAAFLFLELTQPYFFVQDDVFSTEFPSILLGCRRLVEGVFPEWNPFQLLGAPLANVGSTGLTYPPTIISYVIAHYVLLDEFSTMEVFAAIHMLGGYAATLWMLRGIGLRPVLSVLGGLAFVLSGATLIMGRSWHAWIAVVLWFPLLMGLAVRFCNGLVSWRWSLCTGLVIGVAFHVGFSQLWAFGILFFCLAIGMMLLTRRVPLVRALWLIPALLMGIGIALPLLAQQLSIAGDVVRTQTYGDGIFAGLGSILLPWPLTTSPHPNGWGNVHLEKMGHLYYSGTLFAIFFLFAFLLFLAYAWRRGVLGANVWLVCGIVALLFCLGKQGWLWTLLSKLPILDRINNHPFRLLPFFNLFSIAGGGLLIERVLRGVRRPKFFEVGAFVLTGALLGWHVMVSQASFYTFNAVPYPPKTDALTAVFGTGDTTSGFRVLPFAPQRSTNSDYPLSLMHSFPSLYQVPSIDGYDPVFESKTLYRNVVTRLNADPVAAAKAYGMRWLVEYRFGQPSALDGSATRGLETTPKLNKGTYRKIMAATQPVFSEANLIVHELKDANPLAFVTSRPIVPLPSDLVENGVKVDVSAFPAGGGVIVNVLAWPGMTASVDGQVVETVADEWGRLRIDVPPAARELRVAYAPNWWPGGLAGTLCLTMGLLVAWILRGSRWGREEIGT